MRAAWTFAPLRAGAYEIICADPPWPWAGGKAKAGEAHYRTMRLDKIMALPVAALAARDCVLLMWATGPLLDRAIMTAQAWGFAYKSHVVWRKTTINGKARMGCGFWARTMHEPVLIATRGNPRKLATITAVVASCAGVSLALISDKRIKGGQVSAARAIIAMMAAHSHVHYPTIAARIGTTSQSAEVIACRLRTATRGDIRLTRQTTTDAEALVAFCRARGWRAWA